MFERFFGPGNSDGKRIREAFEMTRDNDPDRKKDAYVPIDQVEDPDAEETMYERAERGLRGGVAEEEELDEINPETTEPVVHVPVEERDSNPVKYPETEAMRLSRGSHPVIRERDASTNTRKENNRRAPLYERQHEAMRTREERKSE